MQAYSSGYDEIQTFLREIDTSQAYLILFSRAIEDDLLAGSIFQGEEGGVKAKDAFASTIDGLALGLTIYASVVYEYLESSATSNFTNAEPTYYVKVDCISTGLAGSSIKV